MIETKIGPKIKPKNPKIFNPKIIPNTVLRGWMFSNFFKKVNLKILSTNPTIINPKPRTPNPPKVSPLASINKPTGT